MNKKEKETKGLTKKDKQRISLWIQLICSENENMNKRRLADLLITKYALKNIVKGEHKIIRSEVFVPTSNSGTVILKGNNLIFTDTTLFSAICKRATAVEFVAHTDGTVSFSFTFYGLREK